MFYQNITD